MTGARYAGASPVLRGLGLGAACIVLGAAQPMAGPSFWWVGVSGLGTLVLASLMLVFQRNRALRAELAGAKRRYDDALESMAEGFALFDADERLVYCNRRYLECFPRTAWMRVPGVRISDLREAAIKYGEFKGVDPSNGQNWIASQRVAYGEGGWSEHEFADGRSMVAVVRKTPDGGRVVVWHDVTERKRLERELEHRATHDILTGLPNRAMFRDELRRARARAERDLTELAVMLLDLDRFKEVNDSYGHAVGDELLVEIGRRLEAAVRAGDFVARLGGDEFAILAGWPASSSEAETLAQRILHRLAEPLHLPHCTLRPSASIGFTVYPADPSGSEQLLEHADRALYSAKAAGRSTWASLKAEQLAPRRAAIPVEGLLGAIERGELDVEYQPILAIDTLDMVGVEALVRWNHPELGRLPASAFMPTVERSPAVNALTRCVLGQALAQQRTWHEAGLADLRVWVNLAPRCLAWEALVDTVAGALAQVGLPAHRLVLELTESAIASARAAEVRLAALRRHGIAIAIDDFGAGHSSLGRLKALPLDILKIDRTFVSEIAADERDRAIVRTVTALGANLDLTTTAEGIETLDQLRILRRLGCSLVQGYLFARPMPGHDIWDWHAAWCGHRRERLEAACGEGGENPVGRQRSAA